MDKAKVVCVARIKNEAWIMKRFLETTRLWADHIIIFDQNSEDQTVEIARKFEKVIVVENKRAESSENDYALMIAEARKVEGKKLIFILDADEFLSANLFSSNEWQTMLTADAGSVFNINRINFDDNFKISKSSMRYWIAFMDDGITVYPTHSDENVIHQLRIPFPNYETKLYFLNDIVLLHYVYVVPERVLSKARWYQCYEVLYDKKPKLSIVRRYLSTTSKNSPDIPIEEKWFTEYTKAGIDMTSHITYYDYWWDRKVLEYFDKHGIEIFKKANIWGDKNWYAAYKHYGYTKLKESDFRIPLFNRLVFAYARRPKNSNKRYVNMMERRINRVF